MARVLLAFVSIVCVLQTLAAPAPLQPRAVSNIACSQFNLAADSAIFKALNTFTSIKSSSDPNLLAAEGSLTAADNANRQISDSYLNLDAAPPPADALGRVVSGLQASLASLAKVQPDDSTKAAVASANTSMTTALDAAQKQVAAGNCQPVVFVAPPPIPGAPIYSMVSVSVKEAPATTTLRTRPSFASFAAPEASSTTIEATSPATATVAPANDAVLAGSNGGNVNGAMTLAPSVSVGAMVLVAVISFF
ncbi:hypothetical protein B0H19DRAFT_1061803 [Mycena capillaripes]|nr:hypothetical protein B0H19DRAFT_1061803 [Mycena capillaripes]